MIETNRYATEYSLTDAPLVSVVIPVYNVSRYLHACITSVISQTYHKIEILIIDDGSTDGSGRICDRYAEKDSRIHVTHSSNRGLASARNLGLEKARGMFISFLDSDDWMELHTIETLVRAAMETDADLITAGICTEYVGKTIHRGKRIEHMQMFRGKEILEAFAKGVFSHVAWNKLYRSVCFDGIQYLDGRNYEDVSTTWKIMEKLAENGGKVTVLPDKLFHSRVRRSSITHLWTYKNTLDCWIAYHTLYEALPDYQEKILAGYFMPIGHMWMGFYSYSKEDRAKARLILHEMNAFSKEHFQRVLRGRYSRFIKFSCLISQSSGLAAMWVGYCGGRLREILRNKKYVMYE